MPAAEFLDRLAAFDGEWAERVATEAARGRVLRYRRHGDAADRLGEAGRRACDSSPVGALEGTRNLLAFTTRRYRTEPLVISGPGAGAEVTAAGILNDIYSLSAR